MKELFFAYPGNLDTPTGGYGYDRRVIAGLRDLGWTVTLVSLGDGFPFPDPDTLAEASRRLANLPEGALVIVDGLAFGVMNEAAAELDGQLSLIGLVHHPLCQENGLGLEQAKSLRKSENEALHHVHHVIVTSPATAEQVRRLFGLPPDQITVVLPGTDVPAKASQRSSEKVTLLSVGTVVPRKGHDLLFEALGGLLDHDWKLELIGGLEADPECFQALKRQAVELGLSDRVTFQGAVSTGDLVSFYEKADIFVLASRYEGYGMAYTEAIAHGLPVIGSGEGAVRSTLPESASVYCETENVSELRSALHLLMTDAGKREVLSKAAQQAALELPSWKDASAQFDRVLKRIAA